MATNSNLYNQYPSGSPPPPPMTASTSYNAGYEANYLQPQGSAAYNPSSAYSPAPQTFTQTPGLPPIPPPSRLEQFGSLSLTGINPNPQAIQTSYAAPAYGQASTSQGMTHSVFPLAQPGTYANYSYNPQTPQSSPAATPWWLYLLLCLLLAGATIYGLWYFLIRNKQQLPVQQRVITTQISQPSSTQPVRTVTETITTTQNRYGTASSTKNSVDAVDQDHHSHLRHWVV